MPVHVKVVVVVEMWVVDVAKVVVVVVVPHMAMPLL